MKVIRKDKLIEHEAVGLTNLEKDILFEVDHPFLCGIDYMFQSETRLYFVLPFVGGGVLDKMVRDRLYLEESITKFYAAQILIGLGKLHELGVVHRDMKLENCMVDENGYIKIIDFGLAKVLQEQEQSRTFCGTMEYFAPEVIRKTGYDKSIDFWAVGCMIYKMLFGISPFHHKNRNQLMQKI